MLNFLYKFSNILIVDQATFIIIGKTESIQVANAICKGIMNTSCMVVYLEKELNPEKNYILMQMPIAGGKAGPSNTALISTQLKKNLRRYDISEIFEIPEHIEKNKHLFEIRKKGFELLEQSCMRYISRLVNFIDDDLFLNAISRELDNSNPDIDHYSDGILNWADILNIDPRAAYQQLKLEYDSSSISIIKMHAIWTKYVDKINLVDTEQEILQLVNRDFEVEIFVSGDVF